MKTYYNLRANLPRREDQLPYTIIKFDESLNPESVYEVGRTICTCPAAARLSCRHRDMLPKLMERVDTAWFWCFETSSWEDPTGEAAQHQEVAEHDEATGGLGVADLAPEVVEGTEPELNDELIGKALDSIKPGSSPVEAGTQVHQYLEHALNAGEGPEPSTFAAVTLPSPSTSPRGEPAAKFNRRM